MTLTHHRYAGGIGLLLLSLLYSSASVAKQQVLTAEISNTRQHQIQQAPLSLGLMAAMNQQPQQIHVIDANQQAMPYRIESAKQVSKQTDTALQIYQWPTQQTDEHWQQIEQLKLQLKQGQSETTLTWPALSSNKTSDSSQARTWLLVAPQLDQPVTAQQLLLDWGSKAISSRVQVEGSDNLSDWQFAGTGSILETKSAAQHVVKQQQIDIQNTYRFWRIQFDEPLLLQQATLRSQYQESAAWQVEQVELKPSAQAGQWLLNANYPLEVQRLQFTIPKNQLWSVGVDTLQQQQGRPTWQSAVKTELFDLDATAGLAKKDQIHLDYPVQAAEWRFNLQGAAPQQPLAVTLSSPQRYVVFLAQGQAPYQLRIGGGVNTAAQLPAQLPAAHLAQIAQVELKTLPTSYKQYALWAGLIFLVLLLAMAAWRLLKTAQQSNPES
jgi:hypothetical protein